MGLQHRLIRWCVQWADCDGVNFGVILNAGMFAKLEASALNVDADGMNQLVNPHTANLIPAALLKPLRGIPHAGLHNVYLVGAGLVVVALC